MAQQVAVWHGAEADLYALNVAASHNCDCEHDKEGGRYGTCAAHAMLTDQNVLDHMAFVAANRQQFIDAEQSRRKR